MIAGVPGFGEGGAPFALTLALAAPAAAGVAGEKSKIFDGAMAIIICGSIENGVKFAMS